MSEGLGHGGTVNSSDDLNCEYDSTWEGEHEDYDDRRNKQKNKFTLRVVNRCHRNVRAARDMQNYRHGYGTNYRHTSEEPEEFVNLKFYLNQIPSSPDGVKIQEFHKQWWGDYRRLEWCHSYIQWLFPLQEAGMNYQACELTKNEIKKFLESEEAKAGLRKSYKLMLDFYGIKLTDEKTGAVGRAENWKERFENLNRNTHNNLRITRILKCLGELGFEHYQAQLVSFFLRETLVTKKLGNVKQSVLDYFLFSVRDKKQRQSLVQYAFKYYTPQDEFVWCPMRVQRYFKGMETKETCIQNNENSDCDGSSVDPPVLGNGGREVSNKSKSGATDKEDHPDPYPQESDCLTDDTMGPDRAAIENQTIKQHKNPRNEEKVQISDDRKTQGVTLPLEKFENSSDEQVLPESANPVVSPKDDIGCIAEPTHTIEANKNTTFSCSTSKTDANNVNADIVCSSNENVSAHSQSLTDEVANNHTTPGKEENSLGVNGENVSSYDTVDVKINSLNSPAKEAGHYSFLNEKGCHSAFCENAGSLSATGDNASSFGAFGKNAANLCALGEKGESHSSLGRGSHGALGEKTGSFISVGKDGDTHTPSGGETGGCLTPGVCAEHHPVPEENSGNGANGDHKSMLASCEDEQNDQISSGNPVEEGKMGETGIKSGALLHTVDVEMTSEPAPVDDTDEERHPVPEENSGNGANGDHRCMLAPCKDEQDDQISAGNPVEEEKMGEIGINSGALICTADVEMTSEAASVEDTNEDEEPMQTE